MFTANPGALGMTFVKPAKWGVMQVVRDSDHYNRGDMNGGRSRSCREVLKAAITIAAVVWMVLAAAGHGGAAVAEEPQRPLPVPAPAAPPPASPPAAGQAGRVSSRGVTGRIRGTVLDAARRPVTGLMVELRTRDQAGLLRVTGTDEKGQYLFQELPQGSYDVEVAADGFKRERKEGILVRPPFQNIVDFQMQTRPISPVEAGTATGASPGETALEESRRPGDGEPPAAEKVPVRGTFQDAQRRPVPEVSVTLIALSSADTYQTFSGTDGVFAIPSVTPGPYRVVVESPGYVAIDLKSVTVLRGNGLSLSLSLVEHPLNFKGVKERGLPREEPLPLPAAPPAPGSVR